MIQVSTNVELDQFDEDEIAHYLVHKGWSVQDEDGDEIENDDKHFWTPDVDVDVDVNFDDIDEDDIVDYLESNGYLCTKDLNSIRLESNNSIRQLADDCKNMADKKGMGYWRDLLTNILNIPLMSDDEQILEGVKELLKL